MILGKILNCFIIDVRNSEDWRKFFRVMLQDDAEAHIKFDRLYVYLNFIPGRFTI